MKEEKKVTIIFCLCGHPHPGGREQVAASMRVKLVLTRFGSEIISLSERSRNGSPDKKRSRSVQECDWPPLWRLGKQGWHAFTPTPLKLHWIIARGRASPATKRRRRRLSRIFHLMRSHSRPCLLTVFWMVSVLFMIWILWYLGLSCCLEK